MRIIVVGAGKVGTSLTAQLIREHRVTVIDQEPKLIENIINVYDVMGVCGNGASYEVQKEAEVGKADLLIATTSITGENRENRGRMGKRVLLRRQTATIYAGELNDAAAYYGMDEDLLRRSFSLIVGSWSN